MLTGEQNTRAAIHRLPGRAEAERALETAITHAASGYVLAVVVNDVCGMYDGRGYDEADAVLSGVAATLVERFGILTNVYRWSATCFVVALGGRQADSRVRIPNATCFTVRLDSVRSAAGLFARLDQQVVMELTLAAA